LAASFKARDNARAGSPDDMSALCFAAEKLTLKATLPALVEE
jgi:hypothetical protein